MRCPHRSGQKRSKDDAHCQICRARGFEGMGHGAWGMGHGAWGMGHGAWGMGLGAWGMGHGGMGHGAWGMGHGAWGMGHGAWGMGHGGMGAEGLWGLVRTTVAVGSLAAHHVKGRTRSCPGGAGAAPRTPRAPTGSAAPPTPPPDPRHNAAAPGAQRTADKDRVRKSCALCQMRSDESRDQRARCALGRAAPGAQRMAHQDRVRNPLSECQMRSCKRGVPLAEQFSTQRGPKGGGGRSWLKEVTGRRQWVKARD